MAAQRGKKPFHFEQVDFDEATGEVALTYRFTGEAPFVERITLPVDGLDLVVDESFAATLRLLHLMAGTSYFKTQAPRDLVVETGALNDAEHRLVTTLYDHGMREFAWFNKLDIPFEVEVEAVATRPQEKEQKSAKEPGAHAGRGEPIEGHSEAPEPKAEKSRIARPLVPFGGGKDSTVVLGLLPEATPLTVNPTSTHRRTAEALGHTLVEVRRKIDRVDDLISPESLNGHIPITAIVSAISVAYAQLAGHADVVMANEQAASEPTVWTPDGHPVNHQFSKGATFELLFRDALVSRRVGVDYFSLLRAMTESEITARLASQTDALPLIVSCNRAFKGAVSGGAEGSQAWCGECPKCHFTYLLMATALPPATLQAMFGQDLLQHENLIPQFRELWDDNAKPFECVGSRSEAAAAMAHLATDPQWADHRVVVACSAEAKNYSPSPAPTSEFLGSDATIPPAYLERLAR